MSQDSPNHNSDVSDPDNERRRRLQSPPPFIIPAESEFAHEIGPLSFLAQSGGGTTLPGTNTAISNPNIGALIPGPAPETSPPSSYAIWPSSTVTRSRGGSSGASSAAGPDKQSPLDMAMLHERDARPQRPTGPARTPSNTYDPPRRPAQFAPTQSHGQLPLSAKRARRDPNAQYKAQEKAYVDRLRQGPPNEWFNFGTQIPGVGEFGSDFEDESPSSELQFDGDIYDPDTHLVLEDEDAQPTSEELQNPRVREKLEWHSMLASVLKGDVVRQEKQRLISTAEQKSREVIGNEIWFGIRARTCGRAVSMQRKVIEFRRSKIGPMIEDIIAFKIKGEAEIGKPPLEQVEDVVAEIGKVECLYPSSRQLMLENSRAESEEFNACCDAIVSWHNTTLLINTQLSILQKWVGNDELDFTRALVKSPHTADLSDDGTFLDRVMKEDGLKTLQGGDRMLDNIGDVIKKAKNTLIENAEAFSKMHLPPYIEELLTLINFPSRLIQEVIRVRLSYAKKMKDPGQQSQILLDQMIVQFQILMKVAVEIKERYLVISDPEPGWELPPCVDENFDSVVVDGLKYYFKLLNWKLTGNKNTFKEAEILEQEWDFSNRIGRQLEGGDIEVAEQFR